MSRQLCLPSRNTANGVKEQGGRIGLNNLRLLLFPWVSVSQLRPWLKVFSIPILEQGFETLITLMNLLKEASFSEFSRISSA